MLFASIPDQKSTKKRLLTLVKGERIPHAQLLSGVEGGKQLHLALAMATYMLCQKPTSNDACHSCSACLQNQKYIHPDLSFAFPLPRDKELPVLLPRWRAFLNNDIAMTFTEWALFLKHQVKSLQFGRREANYIRLQLERQPVLGKRRIILFWLPEYLNPTAANALLKSIEEPPANTYLLFVSDNLTSVLPTLQSRTWIFSVPADEKIPLDLKERKAYFTMLTTSLRKAYQGNSFSLLEQGEIYYKSSHVQQSSWVSYTLEMMHHLVRHTFAKLPLSEELLEEEKTFISRLGKILSFEDLQDIIKLFTSMQLALVRNAHPRLLYLSTALHLINLFKKKKEMENET